MGAPLAAAWAPQGCLPRPCGVVSVRGRLNDGQFARSRCARLSNSGPWVHPGWLKRGDRRDRSFHKAPASSPSPPSRQPASIQPPIAGQLSARLVSRWGPAHRLGVQLVLPSRLCEAAQRHGGRPQCLTMSSIALVPQPRMARQLWLHDGWHGCRRAPLHSQRRLPPPPLPTTAERRSPPSVVDKLETFNPPTLNYGAHVHEN